MGDYFLIAMLLLSVLVFAVSFLAFLSAAITIVTSKTSKAPSARVSESRKTAERFGFFSLFMAAHAMLFAVMSVMSKNSLFTTINIIACAAGFVFAYGGVAAWLVGKKKLAYFAEAACLIAFVVLDILVR